MIPLRVQRSITWTEKQRRVIDFRAGPHPRTGELQVERVNALGQQGGGKTKAGAERALRMALENPYNGEPQQARNDGRGYGHGDAPMSAIVAPTIGGLEEAALKQFFSVCPPEAIHSRRLYARHMDITLTNGHVIKCYSAQGAMDGPTLCSIWCDEIQDRAYAPIWHNIVGRVREGRAKRLGIHVTGFAEAGHVERLFRRPDNDYTRTVIFRTRDNPFNAPGYLESLEANIPASQLMLDLDGWAPAREACWPTFGSENFAAPIDLEARRKYPTSIGVDLRRHAAVVFAQREGDGLLIVDQLILDDMSAEAISGEVARRGWNMQPAVSKMAFDPSASVDEVAWFRKRWPDCRVVRNSEGIYLETAKGRQCVDRAVRDARGVIRLWVNPALDRPCRDPRLPGSNPRGVVEALRGYSELKLKDKTLEHVADALRYLVVAELPLPPVETPSTSMPLVRGAYRPGGFLS